MVMAMETETELSCRTVVGNEAHPCRVRNHVKPYTLHRVFPNTSAHAVEATEGGGSFIHHCRCREL